MTNLFSRKRKFTYKNF